MVGKAALAVVLLGAGFVVGVAAVAVHAHWWGLLLAIAAGLAAVLALRPGTQRVGYVAGWLVAVILAAVPRPTGGYAIAGDVPGYLLLGASVVLVILALATLPVKPRSGA